ncbi:MAG: glycosyltransferase family 4 protein [Candidatus Binatia bacterium]
MKVLHLINTLSAGGAELHLLTLCRHLKRQGIELVVACLKENVKGSRSLRADFETEGFRIIDLKADGRYSFRFLRPLVGLVKNERPDIVHTHLPRADFAIFLARFFYPSILWISSVHDIHSQSWSARWALPLFDFVWRRADGVIAISHAVKNWLVTDHRVPSEKVSVIHYGIDAERFVRASNAAREPRDMNGEPVVGSIGRLEPRKGHACLIEGMSEVCKAAPGAKLVIAGADTWDYGKELELLIDRLGLQDRVRLIGFQSDVASFFGSLDVFAFASRAEGFGQVIIEAMAAGKPVVASRVPPLTEIVVHGKTGLLMEPDNPQAFADAIAWLFAHPEEAREMGRHGQERVHTYFSAPRMADETLRLYRSLARTSNYAIAPFK